MFAMCGLVGGSAICAAVSLAAERAEGGSSFTEAVVTGSVAPDTFAEGRMASARSVGRAVGGTGTFVVAYVAGARLLPIALATFAAGTRGAGRVAYAIHRRGAMTLTVIPTTNSSRCTIFDPAFGMQCGASLVTRSNCASR